MQTQLEVLPHQFLGRYDTIACDIFASKPNNANRTPRGKKQQTITKIVKFEEGMMIPTVEDMPSEREMNDSFLRQRNHSKAEMRDVAKFLKGLFEVQAMWTRSLLVRQLTK